jgi:hypothetical protein
MSLLHIRPNADPVIADAAGRPREVVVGDRSVAVTAIEAVREEIAAYPVASGPRTLFVVRAGGARLRVVHEHRARRWTVESIEPEGAALASAA